MKTLTILLLTVVTLSNCQNQDEIILLSLEEISRKLDSALKEITQNKEAVLGKLEEYEEVRQKQNEMLKELKDQQTLLMSTIHQETSGVISFLEKGGIDECSEGIHSCDSNEVCNDKLFDHSCACAPGFESSGSECIDIDECALGIDTCGPHGTCNNTQGSYTCICNPPYVSKGHICRDLTCPSSATAIEGLGCIMFVEEFKTWSEMKEHCEGMEGWQLLQDLKQEYYPDFSRAFSSIGWIGSYDGKWTSSGTTIPIELWDERYKVTSLDKCGHIDWSGHFLVTQKRCSISKYGYCQLA